MHMFQVGLTMVLVGVDSVNDVLCAAQAHTCLAHHLVPMCIVSPFCSS
jgi:hypothetical protein